MILRLLIVALCLSPLGADAAWHTVLQNSSATCSFTRIDFTGGSLGAASLARASANATYVNVSGVLSTATTNAARFNYDANYPAGGTPSLTGPFLLVEPAATNLFSQSNAFTTTWSTGNSPVLTAAAFTSPDGTANGWSMTSGGNFGNIEQFITLTAIPYTMSVWSRSSSGLGPLAFIINVSQGPDNTQGASFVRYKYSVTATAGSFVFNAMMVDTNAAATIGIFGAQFETGSVATSYIATTAGTGTRAADVVTFTQPANCGHNTYTFDDSSTQTVTQGAGTATVPTTLTRPNIKFIDGSS